MRRVQPRECEQLLHQARCPINALHHVLEGAPATVVARGGERHLGVGLQRGERRAQLVGGVAGEAPLVLEGAVEALEELVQRGHERRDFLGRVLRG